MGNLTKISLELAPSVYTVFHGPDGKAIGTVKFSPVIGQYAFYPAEDSCFFDQATLKEIAEELNGLNYE